MVFVGPALKIHGLQVMEADASAKKAFFGIKRQDFVTLLFALLILLLVGKMASTNASVTKDIFGGKISVFQIVGKSKLSKMENAFVSKTMLELMAFVHNVLLARGLLLMEKNVFAKRIFTGTREKTVVMS